MLTGLYWIDIGIALLLAGLWGGAALLTGRLATMRTRRGLRFVAGMTLFVLSVGGLFTLLRDAVVLGMWAAGGWFAEDRLLVGLPLLVPAALVSLVCSLPRLRHLARATLSRPHGDADSDTRLGHDCALGCARTSF